MITHAFKLYADSELLALKQAIFDRVKRWFNEWSGSDEGLLSVDLYTDIDSLIIPENSYSVDYTFGDSSLILSIDEALYNNFPGVLIPLNSNISGGHSPMVKNILSDVFFDLTKPFIKLMNGNNIEPLTLKNNNNVFLNLTGNNGDIIVKISFSQGEILLQLPFIVVDNFNSYKADILSDKPSLVNRNDCLISGNIKLSVNVGGAEIDFGSVVDMQKGDVIRLDSKITDKMKVLANDTDFICDAYLGKHNLNKAIKVII